MAFGNGGKREGAGRKKGVPNKLTTDLKEMILGALDKAGGQDYLIEQSEKNPVAFMTLVGKVLPLQLQGDKNNPIPFVISTPAIMDEDAWANRHK